MRGLLSGDGDRAGGWEGAGNKCPLPPLPSAFLSQLPVGWTHPKSRGQGKALFLPPLLGQDKSGRGLKGQMAKVLT